MVGLLASPIMSVYSGGSENCTLLVRGYNLLEFSPWGTIPVFTVLYVLAILFSCQSKATKHAELLLLLVANCVCYAISVMEARAWLDNVGSSFVFTHFGMFIFPLGVMALILIAMIYCKRF